jgi:hypothetical protein
MGETLFGRVLAELRKIRDPKGPLIGVLISFALPIYFLDRGALLEQRLPD